LLSVPQTVSEIFPKNDIILLTLTFCILKKGHLREYVFIGTFLIFFRRIISLYS